MLFPHLEHRVHEECGQRRRDAAAERDQVHAFGGARLHRVLQENRSERCSGAEWHRLRLTSTAWEWGLRRCYQCCALLTCIDHRPYLLVPDPERMNCLSMSENFAGLRPMRAWSAHPLQAF